MHMLAAVFLYSFQLWYFRCSVNVSGYKETQSSCNFAKMLLVRKTRKKEREKSSITQLYFRNKGIESAMYVMFWPYAYKWKPAANSGRECLCSDSLSLPQALRDIPGQVTVYTARANHVKDLSLLVRPSPVTLGGWRDTIKLPDRLRGRRRGDWTMRKNLTSVSSQSMAFTDCMKPTDLSTEKKGIK